MSSSTSLVIYCINAMWCERKKVYEGFQFSDSHTCHEGWNCDFSDFFLLHMEMIKRCSRENNRTREEEKLNNWHKFFALV